jgi:hypothetical protein
MIIRSESMAQDEFIRKVLERDIRNIFRVQQLAVSQRIYLAGKDLKASRRKKGLQRRTGRLEDSLSSPEYYLQSQGEQFNMAALYPIYIRFLDMKRLGNWKIYNRQIWGILYNNALRDIRYGYGKELADYVGNALRDAFEKYNT